MTCVHPRVMKTDGRAVSKSPSNAERAEGAENTQQLSGLGGLCGEKLWALLRLFRFLSRSGGVL
jgi:hypothetical protein